MPHPTLRLTGPDDRLPPLGDEVDLTPRPWRDAVAALPAGATWVEVVGPGLATHPELTDAVTAIATRGARVRLITDERGLAERLSDLAGAGVGVVRLSRHAEDPGRHDRLVRRPGAATATDDAVLVARACAVKVELASVVLCEDTDALATLAPLATRLGVELHVGPTPTRQRPTAEASRQALIALWAAAEATGADVRLTGLDRAPPADEPALDPPLAGPATWAFLRAGVPLPTHAGVRLTGVSASAADRLVRLAGRAEDIGHHLRAWDAPPVDLPPALGGDGADDAVPDWLTPRLPPGWDLPPAWATPAPGLRVLVLVPAMPDKLMVLLTLPALVEALQSEGATVIVRSVWGDEADPELREARRRLPGAVSTAAASEAGLLDDIDLGAVDLVVAPTLEVGQRALTHPALSPTARVVAHDFHLLHGLDAWTRRFVPPGGRDGDWWPSDRAVLASAFPSFVGLYRTAGVPMRPVWWRPYPCPLDADAVPAATSRVAFAGGNQLRDWAVLAGACARLPAHLPLDVQLLTRHAPPAALPPKLTWHGTVDLTEFRARIAASRFVIVPVPHDPQRASGITVVALALAAGRPVLASRTGALRDHVTHGVSGWLVDPGDPTALAGAIERLATDDALVERLSAGARVAAERASPERWARELLGGATRGWPVRATARRPT